MTSSNSRGPAYEVILYPDQYKSGKLLTPFPAAG